MTSSGIPLVELYRPKIFDDIVLDPLNKQILKNIIETSYFPNLLFYGPPGTGKTTTIINLINAYKAKLKIKTSYGSDYNSLQSL
jgi:replication-associated recombination protein RarA